MDVFLARVTGQAMNFAIRSGITITTTYAVKQAGRLLKETPRSQQRDELMQLQLRLEGKIRIISPAIDMIELISARGNTSLESALTLTKEIRFGLQRLGTRLSDAANEEESTSTWLKESQNKRAGRAHSCLHHRRDQGTPHPDRGCSPAYQPRHHHFRRQPQHFTLWHHLPE